VYVSNILGATLGPIFTGIILLALVTTQQGFVICAAMTFLVGIYCLIRIIPLTVLGLCTLAMATQFVLFMMLNGHQLILRIATPIYGSVIHIVENQYGIITIYDGGKDGDIVAGGNTYDGRTNLDPVLNSNRINRVIILDALVPQPSRVLMIGLSIGSWLKVVTSFPGVEDIDVIEINPGYLQLIQEYPPQESAVLDPRVHIYIDDGRRWLKEHPDNRYDMIIMNTTYHWRAYITNLLSQEFLRLLKRHMNENAVLEYNTTGSPDVLKTATSVFKNAYLYENFVIAADFDWRDKLHTAEAVKKLANLTLDGRPFYPKGSESIIAAYLNQRVRSLNEIEPIYNAMGRQVEIITDKNLITEYKYGKTL
jgi:spermidine synthase